MSARADCPPAAARREAKTRAALHAAYREGLGLAAVVAMREGGAIRIVAMDNAPIEASPAHDCVVAARFWCRRAADAKRVAEAAATRLRCRRPQDGAATSLPIAPADAANDFHAAVEGAAKRLRVALYSDAEIDAEAETAIERVEQEIDKLKRAGQLKSVNQSYRAHRLAASARGERAASYAKWFNTYKANLVRELGAALRYA